MCISAHSLTRATVLKEVSAPGLVQIELIFFYSSKNSHVITSVASIYSQMFLPKLVEIKTSFAAPL